MIDIKSIMESPKLTVINLLSGPSSGKSTIAYGVAAELKLRGISSELVTEVAKDKVWDEAYTILRNQILIAAEQYHRLWRLNDKVEVVVTDSPLILSAIYNSQEYTHFNPLLFELFNEFNNINFFVERRVEHEYETIGRIHDELQALELDKRIKTLLSSNNIPFRSIPCSRKSIEEVLREYDISTQKRWQFTTI